MLQHLEAAQEVRNQYLLNPTHDSLEEFVMLIQNDGACRLLDYSLLTRWITILPFLCACQQALAGQTANRTQIMVLQTAYHLWINQPRGSVREGDLYLYEIWFSALRAVIQETFPEALPRLARREYSEPETCASVERLDLTECGEFTRYLEGWKSEIHAWRARAILRGIRPRDYQGPQGD